ncbi:hypothetical protein B0H19DRAFT_408203 [Mycena capillaripes]|nr:hypothetical protein B0H19DRAFT_408203 [Mycena capillaripes]
MLLVELVSALCTFLILAGHAAGQDTAILSASLITASAGSTGVSATNIRSSPRVPASIIIASVLISLGFVVEIVVFAILFSHCRREQRTKKNWIPPVDQRQIHPDDDIASQKHPPSTQSSFGDNTQLRIPSETWDASRPRPLPRPPSSRPPSWILEHRTVNLETTVDVKIVEPHSPLLHTQFTQFPVTPPSSVPPTPFPSINTFATGETWAAGSEMDKLAVFRLPSFYAQSSGNNDARAISMAAVEESTDRPFNAGQDSETFTQQQGGYLNAGSASLR